MIYARFIFKDGDVRDVRLCRPYLVLRIVHAIGYLFRGATFDGLHRVKMGAEGQRPIISTPKGR
jgi:hypothetical protein